MKGRIFLCLLLCPFMVKAQKLQTFEMRYFTSDVKANGETDFHGETEWMDTEQRVDFLNKYAEYASQYWGNPQLDKPLLTNEEVKDVVGNIKPQPLTNIHRTIRLSEWRAYGFHLDKMKKQQESWQAWNIARSASIEDGALKINHACVERVIPEMNWRFRFKTHISRYTSNCNILFYHQDRVAIAVEIADNHIKASSGSQASTGKLKSNENLKIEIYGDFPSRRFFVTVNDEMSIECPLDDTLKSGINKLSFDSKKGEMILDDILLFSFEENKKNKHTPFYSKLLLDDDFEKICSIEGWQELSYDDSCWKKVNLPSVHGGLREQEESYYLRKKIFVEDFGRAVLKLETLDPGGEVWINGQPAAVIHDRRPVNMDVTSYVKRNSENVIAVRVKPYKAQHLMLHSPSDPYIGWQLGRSELILTNRCMIKDVFVQTERLGEEALLSNQIVLQYAGVEYYKGSVEINYYPWFPSEGEKVASLKQDVEVRPSIDNKFILKLPVKNPQLWMPGRPFLYRVEVILRDEKNNPVDDYVTTTGIRTIEQKNGNLYVNNRVEMLNGAQILGYRYPIETIAKTNRCVSDETVVKDLLMIKKMDANMLRIHVHAEKDTIDGINDPRYAEYADQLGVYLLWQTAGWVREGESWNVDFEGYPQYMKQVYNHPSIVMWEASNHPNRFKRHDVSDSNDYMERIYRCISSVDTSRLISPTSFWQHTHYGNYDGTLDYKGKTMTPSKVLMEKMMTRGNQDAYTGYGSKWSDLRKAPYEWAASCIGANDKAFFNFEHEESAAQPNWELSRKEPWYKVQSYEWEYEENSIGRKLDASEWRASQAFQAFAAWESMKKQILLGYDGFSWCSLESGANMFTYQKPLVDAFGVPKLAFYANKQVFGRIWAASENVDVVYGPDDFITPVIFNLGEECQVDLEVRLKNENGKIIDSKRIKNIQVNAGRSITRLSGFRFKKQYEGCCFIEYIVDKH